MEENQRDDNTTMFFFVLVNSCILLSFFDFAFCNLFQPELLVEIYFFTWLQNGPKTQAGALSTQTLWAMLKFFF